tara:strand:- start:624 stop:866 length:243 start_codon:yes stop_codon:yes gene_type:complete
MGNVARKLDFNGIDDTDIKDAFKSTHDKGYDDGFNGIPMKYTEYPEKEWSKYIDGWNKGDRIRQLAEQRARKQNKSKLRL